MLQAARDALAAFAPIPVLLLPGQHDAAEPGSALARLIPPGDPTLDHVHVLLEAEPIALGGVVFHPCPSRQRHSPDDPTRALPPRPPDDPAVHVVIAHGGAGGVGAREAVARVDVGAVIHKGYDYLALGAVHGAQQVHARAGYPGTPEPTRLHEHGAGQVLRVDLAAPGALPTVVPVPVAGTRWHEVRRTLQGAADVADLEAWLASLEAPAQSLVHLHLSGALRASERARLDALLARAEEVLLLLQVDDAALRTSVSVDDLHALHAPGFLVDALHELVTRDDDAHRDAARLLVSLLEEVRS